jgi:peptidoglycan/LPS O-acetylase OafA/YrhL
MHPLRDGGFDNYLSLIVVCPIIFMFFINKQVDGNSKNIALYSSAIYFTHYFVLTALRAETDLNETPLTVATIIVSVVVSWFVIRLNKKVKFLL